MTARILTRFSFAAGLIAAVSPVAASAAVAQTTPSGDYDRGYQAGRAEAARADQSRGDDQQGSYSGGQSVQQGYYEDDQPEDEGDYADAPPPGYDGSQLPPPPPGYQADARAAADPQDNRYQAYAEDWAQRYCVSSNRGNTVGGAVIGGLFGALIGSSVAGRHNNGAGALMGGIAGAGIGGAAGSTADNATSPGCPPGYTVRGGAPAFRYDGYGGGYGGSDDVGYAYAAPGWYRPWIFVGGRWNYRPYPYHSFYYGHYGRGYGGYGRGFYGRGGYRDRGHWGGNHGWGRGRH